MNGKGTWYQVTARAAFNVRFSNPVNMAKPYMGWISGMAEMSHKTMPGALVTLSSYKVRRLYDSYHISIKPGAGSTLVHEQNSFPKGSRLVDPHPQSRVPSQSAPGHRNSSKGRDVRESQQLSDG